MCRILLANKKGMDLIEEKFGLKNLMDVLERACGGHGNSICIKNVNDDIFIEKAMSFTNEKAIDYINTIEDTEGEVKWLLYHTRIASLGSKSDANCHPFVSGEYILSMNGTERQFGGLADLLKITDTEAICKCIDKFNLDPKKTLCDLSSNFAGFRSLTPFVTSPNTSFKSYDVINHEGAIIIASQLPDAFDALVRVPAESPFYWDETMELKTKKKPKAIAYVNPNNRGNRNTSIPWWQEEGNKRKEEAADKWRKQLIDETINEINEDEPAHILNDSEKKRMLEYINAQKAKRNL